MAHPAIILQARRPDNRGSNPSDGGNVCPPSPDRFWAHPGPTLMSAGANFSALK